MIKKISDLLPKTLHTGTLHQMRSVAVCDTFAKVLKETFPKHAENIVVKYFKDDTIYLGVRSSILASEIRLREPELLSLLHDRLGGRDTIVSHIHIR